MASLKLEVIILMKVKENKPMVTGYLYWTTFYGLGGECYEKSIRIGRDAALSHRWMPER
jgi:hypothetical protein